MISILIFLCLSLVAAQDGSECSEEDEPRPDNVVEESKEDFSDPYFDTQSCYLKKDPGSCNKYRQRWYYNPGCGTCKPFWYGGCEGNTNNFVTFDFCYIRCRLSMDPEATSLRGESTECGEEDSDDFKPTEIVPDSGEDFSDPNFQTESCYLKKDSGSCSRYRQRWYYSPGCGTCKSFWYGGCEGNANNFRTFDMCYMKCRLLPEKEG